jgi:hypothetical protein
LETISAKSKNNRKNVQRTIKKTCVQVRTLWYDPSHKLELDHLLLVVAQVGVYIYASFSIIGAYFQWQDHLAAFFASLVILGQTTLQTIFILDASNR